MNAKQIGDVLLSTANRNVVMSGENFVFTRQKNDNSDENVRELNFFVLDTALNDADKATLR